LTFAMARHAAVDLALVLNVRPRPPAEDRLPPAALEQLRAELAGAGGQLHPAGEAAGRLAGLRAADEPFVTRVWDRGFQPLPAFHPSEPVVDNWQRSAWMRPVPGIGAFPVTEEEEHFR